MIKKDRQPVKTVLLPDPDALDFFGCITNSMLTKDEVIQLGINFYG